MTKTITKTTNNPFEKPYFIDETNKFLSKMFDVREKEMLKMDGIPDHVIKLEKEWRENNLKLLSSVISDSISFPTVYGENVIENHVNDTGQVIVGDSIVFEEEE